LVAEQRKRPATFSPSAISSTISMRTSGKISRNGVIQRRAAGAMLLSDVELVEIAGLASIAAPTAECKAHGAE
jgi:hypothetical protein